MNSVQAPTFFLAKNSSINDQIDQKFARLNQLNKKKQLALIEKPRCKLVPKQARAVGTPFFRQHSSVVENMQDTATLDYFSKQSETAHQPAADPPSLKIESWSNNPVSRQGKPAPREKVDEKLHAHAQSVQTQLDIKSIMNIKNSFNEAQLQLLGQKIIHNNLAREGQPKLQKARYEHSAEQEEINKMKVELQKISYKNNRYLSFWINKLNSQKSQIRQRYNSLEKTSLVPPPSKYLSTEPVSQAIEEPQLERASQ